MPRGSKPGERRGGRQRATPNKRTVLTDRILVAASAHPGATGHDLILILVKDQELPADTRTAIARKSFPAATWREIDGRLKKPGTSLLPRALSSARDVPAARVQNAWLSTGQTKSSALEPRASMAMLEVLLGIAQDGKAHLTERRKAAAEVAEYFLPKYFGRKKRPLRRKLQPDHFGFTVDPRLARELRDLRLQLACLPLSLKLTPYGVAQKATRLQSCIASLVKLLRSPSSPRYGLKQARADRERIDFLGRRRARKEVFTAEEDAEEAHKTARFLSFMAGPVWAARMHLADLREKKRAADRKCGPPLTPEQQADLSDLELRFPGKPDVEPDRKLAAKRPFDDLDEPDSFKKQSMEETQHNSQKNSAGHSQTSAEDRSQTPTEDVGTPEKQEPATESSTEDRQIGNRDGRLAPVTYPKANASTPFFPGIPWLSHANLYYWHIFGTLDPSPEQLQKLRDFGKN